MLQFMTYIEPRSNPTRCLGMQIEDESSESPLPTGSLLALVVMMVAMMSMTTVQSSLETLRRLLQTLLQSLQLPFGRLYILIQCNGLRQSRQWCSSITSPSTWTYKE